MQPVPPSASLKASSELEVDDTRVLLALAGPRNEKLKAIEREAGVAIGMRGNTLLLEGDAEGVSLAERFFTQTAALYAQGIDIGLADVGRALHTASGASRRRIAAVTCSTTR